MYFLLSFTHKSKTLDDCEQKNPQAICDYNATKEEVDIADKLLRTHSTKTHPEDGHLRFFQSAGYYSIEYMHYTQCAHISISTCKRRDFLINLGQSLCFAERSRRQKTPHLLRLEQIRQRGDEDLLSSKRAKCRMSQSKKNNKSIQKNKSKVCQMFTFCL